MSQDSKFNPELFRFDPAETYKWHVFPKTTLAIVTWNRLEYTKKLLDSLLRLTHIPHEFLIVDNGSTDGTAEFLQAFAEGDQTVRLILNGSNIGKARAYCQIQDAATDGLIVLFDNDLELLSNYWLLHVQKAFHAIYLNSEIRDVATAIRVVNCDEYGFRNSGRHEILPIPADRNSPPRSSFSSFDKSTADAANLLDESVVMGWTEFLTGNSVIALPVSLLKKLPLDEQYPVFIGGVDSYFCKCIRDCGGRLGYIENGPVARHNDWPYTAEKIAAYESMVGRRARFDLHYLRWKLRDLKKRLAGRKR